MRTSCAVDLITGAEAIFSEKRVFPAATKLAWTAALGVVIHLLLSLALGVALAAGVNVLSRLKMGTYMLRIVLSILLVAGVSVASWAQDITYRKNIGPLVAQKCLACHGAGSPYLGEFQENPKRFEAMFKGPRIDTYADLIGLIGWPDTGAVMRRLDDGKSASDGKPGNMYQNLGATEEERQKNLKFFKEWVGKDAWKLNRWQARGTVPAITKEDLDKIKVKY